MNEQTRNEIMRRWQAGASMRQIARDLGISRNSVSHVLAEVRAARAGSRPARPSRASLLDPYLTAAREWLARYPDLTVQRLLEELRRLGFTGGYTTLRLWIREERPRGVAMPVSRFETAPGVQAQMDYGTYEIDFSDERRRRVYLFSYLLGYSRRQYLRFVESQDMPTTLREHVRAFEYLGGVAATCLYDNMKVVVTGYDGDVPLYNTRFLAFATHYGFRPWACKPRRPQTKGKVERPFRYVETSLLNGRTFRTLEHLNEVTREWLANVADVRVLRERKKSPRELYPDEQPRLVPLPTVPYDVAPVFYRTVNAEGFVQYRQNSYSVPWRQIGRVLPVRVTENEIIIHDPQVQEIARHVLLPREVTGQRREEKTHRPIEDSRQRHAQLQERFAELGSAGRRFLERLLATQRQGKDQAQRILGLLGSYRHDDVRAALERAARYGAYSHAAVERILAAQARPKSVLETLAEEELPSLPALAADEPVSPRPPADYQQLLDKESDHHEEDPNPRPDAAAAGETDPA